MTGNQWALNLFETSEAIELEALLDEAIGSRTILSWLASNYVNFEDEYESLIAWIEAQAAGNNVSKKLDALKREVAIRVRRGVPLDICVPNPEAGAEDENAVICMPTVDEMFRGRTQLGAPTGFMPAVPGRWLQHHHFVCHGLDGRLYRYNHGRYIPCDEWVRAAVRDAQGQDYQPGTTDAVEKWLRSQEREDIAQPLRGYLNLANGILDLDTLELLKHGPQFTSTIQIPVEWDEKAECPLFDKFLDEAVVPDAKELVYQFIGYMAMGDPVLQKILLLFGPGGNGKSVLLNVIRMVLGSRNVASESLQDLGGGNRFRSANTYGKLANICGDLPSKTIDDTGPIKAYTGGDTVSAERKNKDSFDFLPTCVLAFSCNVLPTGKDNTNAWLDRFVLIDMPTVFRGTDKEDVRIVEKLTEELPGILRKSVEAYTAMRNSGTGQFILPESSLALKRDYGNKLSSVREFLDERTGFIAYGGNLWDEREEEYRTQAHALFTMYSAWCRETDKHPVGRNNFYEQVASFSDGRVRLHKYKTGQFFLGIKLIRNNVSGA